MNGTINRNTDFALKRLLDKGVIDKDTKGILIDRDLVLTEKDTGKVRTYYAYNYWNYASCYLGYRKAPLNEINLAELQEKLRALDIYGGEISSNGEDLIEYIFELIFVAYGFTVRLEQVDLSKQMYQAMMNREISMSDIPVGLGKTHAYLVAAIVYNLMNKRNLFERRNYNQSTLFGHHGPMPMVITTSSIALQKAIEKEYIPSISKMLLETGIINEPITSVQRKGKENYICDLRLRNYVSTLDREKKPTSEMATLEKLQEGSRIDLTEISGITNYDKKRIKLDSKQCFNCSKAGQCRYQRFMKDARSSKYTFQICNHNYYVADVLRRKNGAKPLLPNYKAVIIDEAHKLASTAEDMYGIELDKKELIQLIHKGKPHNSKSSIHQSMIITAKEALRLLDLAFEELKLQIPEVAFDEPIDKYSVRLTSAIKNELNRLRLNLLHLAELQPTQKGLTIANLKRKALDIEKMIEGQAICWLEYPTNLQEGKLFSVTRDLSTYIAHDLFGKDMPFIMTSGTIAVNDDFTYFKKGLGLNKWSSNRLKSITKKSPYNYYKNTLLYKAQNIPFPDTDNEDYIKAISIEVESLIMASHGHALVLFTSYTVMRKVYQYLKEKSFDFPVFQLLKGKNKSIKDYRSSKNGVLLACGSAWEGIDFKGDLLSHLIIVKLPFLIPDPIIEDQRNQYGSFEEFKEKVLIPRMLIRLKQGYGRAIRSEKDTAVISILDPRANSTYKEDVFRALPESRVTHSVEEITEFIKDKKDADYYVSTNKGGEADD